MCGLCQKTLENKQIFRWKIKILKVKDYNWLMLDFAPIDLDINSSAPYWFIILSNAWFYSRPPFNYSGKST